MLDSIIWRDDGLWRPETERYAPRLDALVEPTSEYLAVMKEVWPKKIWPNAEDDIDDDQFALFRLSIFTTSIFQQAMPISALTVSLWKSGLFYAVPLNTRFIYESWGAVQYALQLAANPNREKVIRLTENLLVGAYKADVDLPIGGKATAKAPNVMDFVRALSKIDSNAEANYDLLSSASHPNALQNTYFAMMSAPFSNWSNERFKPHAHRLLESVLSCHESSYVSMQRDIIGLLRDAVTNLDLRK